MPRTREVLWAANAALTRRGRFPANVSNAPCRSEGEGGKAFQFPASGRVLDVMKLVMWFAIGLSLPGCGRMGGSGGSASTNLSIVVWSPFTPATNSYRHIEHLEQLQRAANAIIATNPAIVGQAQARGKLAKDSPLRALLAIPVGEEAYLTWWQSMDERCVIVRSLKTEQRFGQIKINLKTGRIDSAHDVAALFVMSEIERRLRQIVGTREEALRLFRGDSSSPERESATKALAAALFLPPDMKLDVHMSAPGGSNGGHGHLSISTVSSNSRERLAYVGYPRPTFRFGGLRLEPNWTNLNTQSFFLDAEGLPYPKAR
jgi:hypothetical protein